MSRSTLVAIADNYSISPPNSGDLNVSNLAIDDSKVGMGFVVILLDAPRNDSVKTKPVVRLNLN
jgi:hypothetical protein